MIGQMILIGFEGTRPDDDWPKLIAKMIHDSAIGGVVLFAYNVENPDQVKRLNASFLNAGGALAPFICVDQEGGTIQRLTEAKGFVGLPSAAQIAKMGDHAAFDHYFRSASELADLDFNVNFGPVVDLNVNPKNPVIGRLDRSYGRDPKVVIDYAHQFINAHEQAGVRTVLKHFPGHGSSTKDPHDELVDITDTWQPLELDPFKDLVGGGFADMVMVGHLIHPEFSDQGNVPASLSRLAIQDQLRGKLAFRGLVVTDDLDMGAIHNRYGIEEAAVMAVAAGADLLIVANHKQPDPAIAQRIIAAVSRAVDDGRVSREQILVAYRLIAAEKDKLAKQRTLVDK